MALVKVGILLLRRYRGVLSFILIGWFGLIVVLSLTPVNVSSVVGGTSFNIDPSGFVKHAVGYFVLGILAFVAFPKRIWLSLFCFFVAGAGLELMQLYVPARSFNMNDIWCNGIGLVMAGLVVCIKRFRWKG